MQIWIIFTVFAAFVQNIRFVLQRNLHHAGMSASSATFARFIFGAPIALMFLLFLIFNFDYHLPTFEPNFVYFSLIGGTAQILATIFTIKLFGKRNFSVGIIFTKTEIIQTAIVGFIFLGEALSVYGSIAIMISFLGILCLSEPKKAFLNKSPAIILNKTAIIGVSAGTLFAISSVGYRGASLSLVEGNYIIRAATTLTFVTIFQAIIMSIWFAINDKNSGLSTLKNWRISCLVGITGVLGSYAWFLAFTLQNAAYVRALGQIELVFTFLASYFFLKEKNSQTEMIGIFLILLSVFLILKSF